MKPEVSVHCECGAVHGSVDVRSGSGVHIVCYCEDCQTYAHWLGRAERMLDADGGTDVVLVYPPRIRLDGADRLRAMRQSPKGPLRWYAECCRTAVANTLPTSAVPFASILFSFVDPADRPVFGPPIARIFGRDARHGLPDGAARKSSFAAVSRATRHLLFGRLRGLHRPSPFFDAQGAPISAPALITREEREALRQQSRAEGIGAPPARPSTHEG